MSRSVPSCENVHSWRQYTPVQIGDWVVGTMTQYSTQSHYYLDTEQTRHHSTASSARQLAGLLSVALGAPACIWVKACYAGICMCFSPERGAACGLHNIRTQDELSVT